MVAHLLYAGIGFVAGCFCPGLASKIRAKLRGEAVAAETDAINQVKSKL